MGEYLNIISHLNMFPKIITLLVVYMSSQVLSTPDGPPLYGPGPVEKLPPKPFSYQYGVSDDYSKNSYQKTESQDQYGNVQGSFVIALPDGRIQTTKYTADHGNGFIAEVTYEGTPVYPPIPKGGYAPALPVRL